MKKHILTSIIILLSLNLFSQSVKETVTNDSLPSIAVIDINKSLEYIYGKVSKKEYELIQQAYNILINTSLARKANEVKVNPKK